MFKLIKPPKWFKRWRKRRLERLAANRINPNLLPFPKHVIYGAVGHPDVPEMDPESAAKRKQIMIESLGFDPEAFADDDEEGEGAVGEGVEHGGAEDAAAVAGGGGLVAPVQRVVDFMEGRGLPAGAARPEGSSTRSIATHFTARFASRCALRAPSRWIRSSSGSRLPLLGSAERTPAPGRTMKPYRSSCE